MVCYETKSHLLEMLARSEKRFVAIVLKATLLVTAGAVLFMPKIDFDLSTFAPNYLVGTVQAAEAPPQSRVGVSNGLGAQLNSAYKVALTRSRVRP